METVPRPHAPRWSAAVAVLLLAATLWPAPGAPQPLERFCIICGSLGGLDFVANVVVFVPFGLALVRDGFPPRRAWLIGFALSLAIELLQWQLIPGRDASAGDLLSNTLGTGIGGWLAEHWRILRDPDARSARRLLIGWCVLVVAVAGVAAWSLRVAEPDLVYFSQWTPVRGGYRPISGTFGGLRLFGEPLPNGVAVDPTDRPASYGHGVVDLEGVLDRPNTVESGPVLLLRLGNPLGEQAQVVQRGDALVFRSRRNASRLALRSPTFVLDGAWTDSVATTFRVHAGMRDVELAAQRTTVLRVSLGRAWQTIAPFEVQYGQFEIYMAALFLAGLLFPAAFYSGRAPGPASWFVPLGLAALILGVIPTAAGIAPGGIGETVGALMGGVAGGWLTRRRTPR
ncbi:MAG: VanZ family protein [Gemmatimonadetes bacterium]|nr:VanZ family protein [Gemmatimonadota bacterium]